MLFRKGPSSRERAFATLPATARLDAECSAVVARDAEYRLREVVHEAVALMAGCGAADAGVEDEVLAYVAGPGAERFSILSLSPKSLT